MFTKKTISRTMFVLSLIAIALAILIGSVTFPTNVRALNNTIQVTTTADTTSVDSQCSLREAIINANDNALTYPECLYGVGNLSIAFDSGLGTATITLTSPLPAITHTAGLTIDGGSHITISGNNLYRVFIVNSGVPFTLDSLTVTNGKATPTCSGADNGFGGGVYNNGGTLTIQNSTFSNNSAVYQSACGGDGGGVYNSGTVIITNSTFSGNNAGLSGGGVYTSGTATITTSTFLSNVAASGFYGGGGVFNFGTLTITNSTFALNSGIGVNGGGVYNHTGTATLTNNTFSYNSASSGGDIYNSYTPAFATLNLYNNILANSLGGGDCFNNAGTVHAGYNMNEDVSNGCNLPIGPGGNYIGSDPGLSSLYVSPPGSPGYFPLPAGAFAIDLGDDARCAAAPVNNDSQNGLTRPQGAHCDIGSYERDVTAPTVLSSVRVDPNPTNASSVDFTVTFSEPVSGVNTADFTLTTTGSVSGAAVTSAIGSGATTTVTVNTGSGNGTIRLNVVDDDTIVDTASNPLGGMNAGNGNFNSGETYTIDHIPPSVNTIARVNANPTNLASVDFTITFSESVTGVNAGDFSLTTTGVSGAAVSGVSGSGSIYTVTVNTGSGDGTIRLDVVNDNTIKDASLNPLGAGFTSGEIYTVIKLAIFADVPLDYWAWDWIERLYKAGVTGGCSVTPLNYCPDSTVTRAQMAVFLLKGMHGSSYTPPAVGAGSGFTDVATDYWAAAWIKQLAAEGITGGCGAGIYCPDATVTRAQMAIFLLKAKHGSSYSPPAATGVFTDVPVGYWADKWIEQLASEGITGGCGTGIYCPDNSVTRAQMAVFLVKTFNLP